MAVGTYISIITLSVNRLNAPTKKHRLAEWTQKQDPHLSISIYIYICIYKKPTLDLKTHRDLK